MCNKCNHIHRTTIPTNIVKIVVVVSDIAIACPTNPNIPPKRKNHHTLPAWNDILVLIWFLIHHLLSLYSFNPKTILPTIARQVETDATIPIKRATPNES